MKIAIALSLLLSASDAVSADSWWKWNDGQWCFRSEVRRTCLPSDYQATEITTDQVRFVCNDPVMPARFIEFRSNPKRDSGEGPFPPESFILSSEHATNEAHIAKYVSNKQSGGLHHVTIFVVTLDKQFTLLIYGSDDDALSDLTQSIVRQWKDK